MATTDVGGYRIIETALVASRAAEKQKRKGCVGVAFYKQATPSGVENSIRGQTRSAAV
jgi:hypothetical protein